MFIRSELAWVIDFPVPCGNCEKEFLERAARLVSLAEIGCPHCGALLSLDGQEWTAFRHQVEEFTVGKSAPIAPVKQAP